MKIGNIVSEIEINIGAEYNYVNDINMIDSALPTLIIGYSFIKTLYDKVDMIDRKISDNLYWTFTKKEYRKFFNSDVEDFMNLCHQYITKRVGFFYLDLIQEKRLFTITKRLLSMENLISFEHEDMIYSYNPKKNVIIGFDLYFMEYMGLNVNKIKSKIKSKSSVFLKGNLVLIEYINYVEHFDNKAKYIPFLYFINNHDKNTFTSEFS